MALEHEKVLQFYRTKRVAHDHPSKLLTGLIKQTVINLIKVSNEKQNGVTRCLDFGCGTGKFFVGLFQTNKLDNLKDKIELVGIDLNEAALRVAIERRLDIPAPSKFLHGGINDLSLYSDGYFDVGTTCSVLNHIHPDLIERAVSQLQRTCKALFIAEPSQINARGSIDPNWWVYDYSKWGFEVASGPYNDEVIINPYHIWQWGCPDAQVEV